MTAPSSNATRQPILLHDGWLVPMDGPADHPLGEVRRGSLRLLGDRIVAIGKLSPEPSDLVLNLQGHAVLPGFVQGHLHATQTLFRGLAGDLPLLPWLQQRIWPLEHAHDADSTAVSAALTAAELLLGGTTAVMTMESVRHTEATCAEFLRSGLLAIVGNCLMDRQEPGMPAGMAEAAPAALRRCEALIAEFHGREQRLFVAIAPRFLLSCSDGLLHDAAALQRQHGLRIHTHAAEHPAELAAVHQRFGQDNLAALANFGLLGNQTGLAHCVHLSAAERELLVAYDCAVLHCPSTNLKLGSGIAPLADYLQRGLRVALGADGAPCNDRLSAWTELRQAALLQNLVAGPGAVPAARLLWQASRGGALALGLGDTTGCLQPGLRADVLVVALDDFRHGIQPPPAGLADRLVYAADERALRHVFAGGRHVVADGCLLGTDLAALRERATSCLSRLLPRAGLAR